MLRNLRIAKVAIIDEIALEFAPGLNVLTGETGAGKSIIMQALDLLCGARGSTDVIRTGEEEAVVEAVFDVAAEAQSIAAELGVEVADELSIRRVVARAGKGKTWLNGSPTSVTVLAQIGLHLMHIYGQHAHALLLQPETHLDLLEAFGNIDDARAHYRASYDRLRDAHARWIALTRGDAAARDRTDLLRFQANELEAAGIEAGEESALAQEREVLRHTEQLALACHGGEASLYSGDEAASPLIARVRGNLQSLLRIEPALGEIATLLETAQTQVDEAALRLRDYAEGLSDDPERLATVDDRLALIRRLGRKYDCPADRLAAKLDAMRAELDQLSGAGLNLEDATAGVMAAAGEAWREAHRLSAARRLAARELERRIVAELPNLGMAGAAYEVRFESEIPAKPAIEGADPFTAGTARLTERGADRVEFYLSANAGEAPRPLAKVASGGELSRIMLALKVLTTGAGEVATLVFDEVDTGIGGLVAETVGRRLKELARGRQILCITHLPQIAVHADHHFAIEKRVRRGRTVTVAKALSNDERVAELSRMLGGGVARRDAEHYARRLVEEASKPSAVR